MNVLVCPTAFKGTLSATEAARAVADGVRAARPPARVDLLPVSDGGPGLLDALSAAAAASDPSRISRWRVSGPVGTPVVARCLWRDPHRREGVLESADACGLHLLGDRPAPLAAHTLGVGQCVVRAVGEGARTVRIGLGGSATTDGGTGMARAFGYRFLDSRDREIPPGGGGLVELARIEPGRPPAVRCVALADVETPLTGHAGAARAFAPQKGASEDDVERLERGLERLRDRIRLDLDREVGELAGAGAAGGLGAGCAAFLGATIVPGSAWTLDAVGFDAALARADLVVTGEGAFDGTSRRGKVVGRILERARARAVPIVLVCGRLEARAPEARRAVDAAGRTLDAEGLASLTRNAVRDALWAG